MAPPFNINNTSPADNALVSAFPNDERSNRTLIEEWLSFISDPATGLIRASALPPAGADEIPSGSKMVFFQAAAPTGWTQDVTHNNKAIRLVNGVGGGTGGTTGFTSVFASRTPAGTIANTTATGSISSVQVTGTTDSTTQGGTIGNTTSTGTVGGHALTTAEMPVHSHGASGLTFTGDALAAHSHTMDFFIEGGGGGGGVDYRTPPTSDIVRNTSSVSAGTPSGTIGGSTANAGSGNTHTHSLTMNAHNHTFTGSGHTHTFTSNTHNHTFTGTAHNHTFTGTAMDFAVQYVDMIICTRN